MARAPDSKTNDTNIFYERASFIENVVENEHRSVGNGGRIYN